MSNKDYLLSYEQFNLILEKFTLDKARYNDTIIQSETIAYK